MCCFSFLGYFCKRSVAYNGKKNHAITCVVRLVEATTLSTNFDLWMSRGSLDNFALVINYLNEFWMPQHATIGLIEVHDTTWLSMASQLHSLLEKYDLMHCMITFVKDEDNNLMSMATTLCSIVDYHLLKLQWVYEGTCFGHIMPKTYKYAINDEKMTKGLKQVSVKATQRNLRKTITWI